MSWHECIDPAESKPRDCSGVATVVAPRERDLGGFTVARMLPASNLRTVGPFVFLDRIGPAVLQGDGIQVRPHPHIGLATVTYLLEGALLHRDSLGSEQTIRPGDVNWMTAGRGIVHSERSTSDGPGADGRISGVQAWVALPEAREEMEPSFDHHPASSLPRVAGDGFTARAIAGTLLGQTSPVHTESELFCADVELDVGAVAELDRADCERALHVLSGSIQIGAAEFGEGNLVAIDPGAPIELRAGTAARVLALGGKPLGHRHVWWNFVSSRRERIERAKQDWRAGRFPPVSGDPEFIPLPEP